ncbi:MAG: LamG domain-containing protein, partial [SAR324 cluster bacterium]|nr:LamG domain-containing protein [SAR324 cluster bacterium]
MAEIRIIGYADQISVKAGEKIQFMISAEGTDSVKGDIVKLIHGDEHPDGPGFIEEAVETELKGQYKVKKQYVQVGSFVEVEDSKSMLDLTKSFTLYAFIWPSTPDLKRQGILTRWSIQDCSGYALGINPEGKLEFWVGDGKKTDKIYSEVPLEKKLWYFVAASYDSKTQKVSLYQEPVVNSYNSLLSPIVPFDYSCHTEEKVKIQPVGGQYKFLLAGCNDYSVGRGGFVNQIFNGKIDRCGVHGSFLSRAELDRIREGGDPPPERMIAHWDPTIGYSDLVIGDQVIDISPNKLHGMG